MERPRFNATLSNMELSNTTEPSSPITEAIGVLYNLARNHDSFLVDCSSDSSTSDSSKSYDYESYESSNSSYSSSSESNTKSCDPEEEQFNQDIELGYERLVDNSTSKTIFIIGFTSFESIHQDDIETSYQDLISLFKSRIIYFLKFSSQIYSRYSFSKV